MIAVRVQHHPSRAELVTRILGVLPEAVLVTAESLPGQTWPCYRACMESMPREASHLLVLQDDVVPHPALPALLPRLTAARPDQLVSLYHGWLPQPQAIRVRAAGDKGESWAEVRVTSWCPAQALIYPRALALDFLERTMGRSDRHADDATIAWWLRVRQERVWVTVPNLVEHPDDAPSMISKRQGSRLRHSCCQPAEDCDPLLVEW